MSVYMSVCVCVCVCVDNIMIGNYSIALYSFVRGLPFISGERGLEDFSVKRQFFSWPPKFEKKIAGPPKLKIKIRGPPKFQK